MRAVRHAPPPVIAAVHGSAYAAGCQLVATCDLAISHPATLFATPGVKIGLFCHTPAVAVSRAIGARAALPMLLTGAPIGAPEALRLGLVHQVTGDGDGDGVEPGVAAQREVVLRAAAMWARQIAGASAETMREGKRVFYEQAAVADVDAAYGLASDAMTRDLRAADAVEGIDAFLKKRPPEWTT